MPVRRVNLPLEVVGQRPSAELPVVAQYVGRAMLSSAARCAMFGHFHSVPLVAAAVLPLLCLACGELPSPSRASVPFTEVPPPNGAQVPAGWLCFFKGRFFLDIVS